MHELSLFAQIPNGRLPHILRAMTLTTAAVDFYYLKLVADISASESENNVDQSTTNGLDKVDGNSGEVQEESKREEYDAQKQKWTIRFADLPEVSGKRPVTSRLLLSADIGDGNALVFMDSLGYTLTTESIHSFDSFTYHSLYITLTQILLPRTPFTPFPVSKLVPLDSANSYIMQVSVRVGSANELESMNKAMEELKAFKAEMKGTVELEVGDRLALDTRVR